MTERLTVGVSRSVIGLGGDFGDDRVGWHVIDLLTEALASQANDSLRLMKASSPADLLGSLECLQELTVVDACQGLHRPGNILRLTWPTAKLNGVRHACGHNLALEDVLDLALQLGRLQSCELWCVEGRQFEFGHALSPEVKTAAQQVAAEIADRLIHQL